MNKKLIKLWLTQESIEILENYAFFQNSTMDEIADSSIRMMPFHEARTRQIQEFHR